MKVERLPARSRSRRSPASFNFQPSTYCRELKGGSWEKSRKGGDASDLSTFNPPLSTAPRVPRGEKKWPGTPRHWENVVAVATFRSWRSSRACPCMAPGRRGPCGVLSAAQLLIADSAGPSEWHGRLARGIASHRPALTQPVPLPMGGTPMPRGPQPGPPGPPCPPPPRSSLRSRSTRSRSLRLSSSSFAFCSGVR